MVHVAMLLKAELLQHLVLQLLVMVAYQSATTCKLASDVKRASTWRTPTILSSCASGVPRVSPPPDASLSMHCFFSPFPSLVRRKCQASAGYEALRHPGDSTWLYSVLLHQQELPARIAARRFLPHQP